MVAVISLDFVFGDPRWVRHPVTLIGQLASQFEKWFRRLLWERNTCGGPNLDFDRDRWGDGVFSLSLGFAPGSFHSGACLRPLACLQRVGI